MINQNNMFKIIMLILILVLLTLKSKSEGIWLTCASQTINTNTLFPNNPVKICQTYGSYQSGSHEGTDIIGEL